MGLLPDMQFCGLRLRRECRERFPHHPLQRKPLVSYPSMHHGHVGIANPRWWGKRSRYSRCMRNPQICGKRPIAQIVMHWVHIFCPNRLLWRLAFSSTFQVHAFRHEQSSAPSMHRGFSSCNTTQQGSMRLDTAILMSCVFGMSSIYISPQICIDLR